MQHRTSIAPAFKGAWRIFERLELLTASEAVMDRSGVGVMFLSRSGTIIYANCTAERMLGVKDALCRKEGGLAALDRRADQELQRCLQECVRPLESARSWAVRVPRIVSEGATAWRREYQAIVANLRTRLPAFAGMPQPTSVVFIVDPEQSHEAVPASLQMLYGLTPKESELAAKLAEGKSVEQVADELFVTYETTRTHLRRILSKTGTSRQTELVLLIAGLTRLGNEPVASFLLVHGSWQGAWCWDEVAPRLRAMGHHVRAIDLPGHGADSTPLGQIGMSDYVRCIRGHLFQHDHGSILVGHSMGGVISQAAEIAAKRVHASVYLAALVVPHGANMMQFVEQYDPEFPAHFEFSADGSTAGISAEGARRFLYANCDPERSERAIARLTAEPVAPFKELLSLSASGYGSVPRHYIECLRDKAIPVLLQRQMRSAFPFDSVHSIDTDHSPFLSTPDELTDILHSIATFSR